MTTDTAAITTTELVRRSIEGRRFSLVNALIAFTLLFTLLSSVVILVTLLADTIAAGSLSSPPPCHPEPRRPASGRESWGHWL